VAARERWVAEASEVPGAPIGPLDAGSVSAPTGLFRHTFVIAGARHRVPMFRSRRFQNMVDTARRAPTA
jgi:hypothetical protein